MRILAVGDVVGPKGTAYIQKNLWRIRKACGADAVILNGENAAKGNGLDKGTAETLFAAGADVITSGNHIWQKHETRHFIDDMPYLLRPANYPAGCPGASAAVFDTGLVRVLVISMLGTVFMGDAYASPFLTADAVLERFKGTFDAAVIDFHAEATSEKAAFARYLDGRVSAVFGTHTHVQTNDARVLPRGTGFVTDIGMTGVYESIIGVKVERVMEKFLTKMPVRFEEPDEGGVCFNGAVFDVDDASGLCTGVELLVKREGEGEK